MRKIKQSTNKNVMILMVSSNDHITGANGLTLTITLSKDGGAFSSISPVVTDRGNGWYALALTSAHTNTIGDLVLHITATGADPSDLVILVEAGSTDADITSRASSSVQTQMLEVWQRLGLDPDSPMTTNNTTISFASIVQAMVEVNGAVTVTRQ